MKEFTIMEDGEEKTVAHATWIHPEMRDRLNPEKEIFIRIEWKATVPDLDHGYWEKGMTSLPLVVYMLNGRTTHRKVAEHLGIRQNKIIPSHFQLSAPARRIFDKG